jgi:glutamine amidotransferase
VIAIIDYRAGNLTSVRLAFESLGIRAKITDSPTDILQAERAVFPGVGAAGSAMKNLTNLGLVDVINAVIAKGTPFLGICLGTQILLERTEEDGGVACLGFIRGTVRRFQPANRLDKVPQMGWNSVSVSQTHPLFTNIRDNSEFYFVHSYYPAPSDRACILGETAYADAVFASAVARNNVVATQFHPEKSGRTGLQLLTNFCSWNPG